MIEYSWTLNTNPGIQIIFSSTLWLEGSGREVIHCNLRILWWNDQLCCDSSDGIYLIHQILICNTFHHILWGRTEELQSLLPSIFPSLLETAECLFFFMCYLFSSIFSPVLILPFQLSPVAQTDLVDVFLQGKLSIRNLIAAEITVPIACLSVTLAVRVGISNITIRLRVQQDWEAAFLGGNTANSLGIRKHSLLGNWSGKPSGEKGVHSYDPKPLERVIFSKRYILLLGLLHCGSGSRSWGWR